jgi:transcriptional regulator with XRE-family HTH domain
MDTKPIRQLFRERLRRLVAESDESDIQRRLAEAAGVSQSTISRMLNANTNIKADTIDAIAKAFGMSGLDFLLNAGASTHTGGLTATYNHLPEAARKSIDDYVRFIVEDNARRHPGSLSFSRESSMDKTAAQKAAARIKAEGEIVGTQQKRKRGRPRKAFI